MNNIGNLVDVLNACSKVSFITKCFFFFGNVHTFFVDNKCCFEFSFNVSSHLNILWQSKHLYFAAVCLVECRINQLINLNCYLHNAQVYFFAV